MAIDQPVEVTGVVDLAAGAVVSISGEPAVTLSGIVHLTGMFQLVEL